MMRAIAFAVPPEAPTLTYGPVGKGKKTSIVLNWVDNSATATGFTLERAADIGFTQNLITVQFGAGVTTYTDLVGTLQGPFYYRIRAVNTVGSNVVGYPTITATGPWSNVLTPPQGATTLTVTQDIVEKSPVVLNWSYTGSDSALIFGYLIQRSGTADFAAPIVFEVLQDPITGVPPTTFVDDRIKGSTQYYYRVAPLGDLGPGPWSNTAAILTNAR
jgi:hypothetical protein